jgi:hypothetical protein
VSRRNLASHLNDHLAGAVAALGLCDRLRLKIHDSAVVRVLTTLRRSVEQDRARLRSLMRRFGIAESRIRKLVAVVAQKLANLKLRLSSSRRGDLQLLHALDVLSHGIQARKSLWTTLDGGRADEQLAILRDLRIEVARRALRIGEDEDRAAGQDHAQRTVPPL